MSFTSCTAEEKTEAAAREEYIATYEKRMKNMGVSPNMDEALIAQWLYEGEPWVTDRIRLPDSEVMVSPDVLRDVLHIYQLQTGKTPSLTAEEIVDLYSAPDAEKQGAFDDLYRWYANENVSEIKERYYLFLGVAYRIYQDTNGAPFLGKELRTFPSEDRYALAQWALDNIDYELTGKTAHDPDADYVTQGYYLYLRGLGRIDRDGKPISGA